MANNHEEAVQDDLAATAAHAQAHRLFEQGLALHRQGQLDEAMAIYERVLRLVPEHADALHHVGIIAFFHGKYNIAVGFMRSALAINPHLAALYCDLGNAFKELKRFDEALQNFDQAIALDPNDADAFSGRGAVLKGLKQFDAALKSCDQAIALRADHFEAYNYRGDVLKEQQQFASAMKCYDKAIELNPDYAEAHFNRGTVFQNFNRMNDAVGSYGAALELNPYMAQAYDNRGCVLEILKRPEEALQDYENAVALKADWADAHKHRAKVLQTLGQFPASLESADSALALVPGDAEAHNLRGRALHGLRQFEAALASQDQAIALKPDFAFAYCDRGNALRDLERFGEAIRSYDKAIALNAGFVEAYNNRAMVEEKTGQYKQALKSYDKAIALEPNFSLAHWNKGLMYLKDGNFAKGWPEYEWRWTTDNLDVCKEKRAFSQPLWLGQQSLKGKTILLYSEQGLGDTLQFCRYAKCVAELGAKVLLEVHAPLVGLLAGLEGVSEVFAGGSELPPFDYQCPLMSLPLAFKTSVASIPSAARYLSADPHKVAEWAAVLGEKTSLRVGVVWSGNPKHANDLNRSIAASEFSRCMSDRHQFVSLQKEVKVLDKAVLGLKHTVGDYGSRLKDFADTAALCELMDVVITVDTSVAHLAAALGKQTWILLPVSSDWRWLTERSDSPWYPSATLYRQTAERDWRTVLAQVRADLDSRAAQSNFLD